MFQAALLLAALFTNPAPAPSPSADEPCASEFCCRSCTTSNGVTSCKECSAYSGSCAGDVYSCVGCYTGGSECRIGSASNTCCD